METLFLRCFKVLQTAVSMCASFGVLWWELIVLGLRIPASLPSFSPLRFVLRFEQVLLNLALIGQFMLHDISRKQQKQQCDETDGENAQKDPRHPTTPSNGLPKNHFTSALASQEGTTLCFPMRNTSALISFDESKTASDQANRFMCICVV